MDDNFFNPPEQVQNAAPAAIVPSPREIADSLRTLEQSLIEMEYRLDTTQDLRQAMIEKLAPTVLSLDMSVNPKTDPDVHQAQSRLLSEFRGLLNDMDNASKSSVSMKLKQKDLEIKQETSINAADILANVKLVAVGGNPIMSNTPVPLTHEELQNLVDKQFEERGCIVIDTELATGNTQLPVKSNDEFDLPK